ncbi:YciI family protein [Nonomuraea sp. NPDC050536]|uniref:YciI family protein n=1 Tax=Nonomuraea sp. NPDC050536 TaxID=3364366 RepID=UPI0037CC4783
MQFMLMTYGEADTEPFDRWLAESGELLDKRVLADPVDTRRFGPGDPTAEESVAACWVVDCDSFDRATEIAARLLASPVPGHVDVRPIQ